MLTVLIARSKIQKEKVWDFENYLGRNLGNIKSNEPTLLNGSSSWCDLAGRSSEIKSEIDILIDICVGNVSKIGRQMGHPIEKRIQNLCPNGGQSAQMGANLADMGPEVLENQAEAKAARRRLEGFLGYLLLGFLAAPGGRRKYRPLQAAGWWIKFCAAWVSRQKSMDQKFWETS